MYNKKISVGKYLFENKGLDDKVINKIYLLKFLDKDKFENIIKTKKLRFSHTCRLHSGLVSQSQVQLTYINTQTINFYFNLIYFVSMKTKTSKSAKIKKATV